MEKVNGDDLNKILIFNNISGKTFESIKNKCYKMKLKKGEILFREKEKVCYVYAVLSGKVTMYRNTEEGQRRVVYILNGGEMINEVIFDYAPASISCEAFEESIILFIYRDELLDIMSKDFILTENIIKSMSKKIRRLYRQIKNTVPIKMDKRIAAKLWKLSKDYGLEVDEGVLINLNITVTYLADMLGSSRETISRAISQLNNQGLIKYENRKMIVKRDELSKYFRGV